MRMRPASLTAAAPPSSCQVTQSVRPMEASASTSSAAPMRMSLVDRDAVGAIVRGYPASGRADNRAGSGRPGTQRTRALVAGSTRSARVTPSSTAR